jgi:hypothetical protein
MSFMSSHAEAPQWQPITKSLNAETLPVLKIPEYLVAVAWRAKADRQAYSTTHAVHHPKARAHASQYFITASSPLPPECKKQRHR